MSNIIAKFADAVTPALLALPLAITVATVAHAQPTTVRFADLDLGSKAGQTALHARVETAASSFCGEERNLSVQAACKAGVRQEVQEKLAMAAPTAIGASAIAAR